MNRVTSVGFAYRRPAGRFRNSRHKARLLRNRRLVLGYSIGASDGVVVRALERAGGREAVCARVVGG